MINIAINGFGRIGRRVFRLLLNNPNIQVVAINDLANAKTLSHLLKYDSIHGVLNEVVSFDMNHIIVNDKKIPLLNKQLPKDINWEPFDVDLVVESSGKFKIKESLNFHIKNGAKQVHINDETQNFEYKIL